MNDMWPLAESEEVEEGSCQRGVEEEKRRLFESLLDTCGEPRMLLPKLQKPSETLLDTCGGPRHVVAKLQKPPPAEQCQCL